MNNNSSELALVIRTDRNLVWKGGSSVRYLVAEVTAPPAVSSRPRETKKLNVSLVIDASGSMAGNKLEAAKRAAEGVIHGLHQDDRLSVVSFSNDVIHHVASQPMGRSEKAAAIAAVASLNSRQNTNLSAGWLAGAAAVAEDTGESPEFHGHVIVLSDGQANEGETRPAELAHIAENLRLRSLYTSTVGIGNDYSTTQLQAISEAGGGRMHYAETPEEIIEVVLAEIEEVRTSVADNCEIQIELPVGVAIEVVGTYPMTTQQQTVSCAIGSLGSLATRQVGFKVTTPKGEPGEKLVFGARCTWGNPGDGRRIEGRQHELHLTFAEGGGNSSQPRDIATSVIVARLWQAMIVRKAVQLNRDGDYQGGSRYLLSELKFFERYCAGLPDTGPLIEQLKQTLQAADRPWDESSRKEIEIQNYKSSRSDKDHRSRRRPNWDTFLPPR